MKITHALAIIFVPISLYMWHLLIDIHIVAHIQLDEESGYKGYYNYYRLCCWIHRYSDSQCLLPVCIDY